MKKLLLIGLFALGTHTIYAQTDRAVQEAKEYVKNTGIDEQFEMMKAQYSSIIKDDKVADFTKEFAKLKDDFYSNLANTIVANYDEKELIEANKKIKETGEFVELPAAENDEEMNQTALESQQRFLTAVQGLVMKYGDQAKIQAIQQAQQNQEAVAEEVVEEVTE